MNNQLQIFENKEIGKVRVLELDGQPWFVGKDVTDILGYGNGSRDINRHVDAEDRRNYRNGTSEINNRGVTIINESGLYALILSSKLPSAKRFKRWVTSEILPTIRKHGAYVTHSGPGEGLLFYGNVIIPFVDRFPKDTELYTLLTTRPSEVAV